MAYRSYGSYGSFQRQPQQNSYRRILESNREQKQDFQVNENRIAQQQQSYLEVMRQKIRDEQANRDRNFQLEMEFKEDYQEAVERNALAKDPRKDISTSSHRQIIFQIP